MQQRFDLGVGYASRLSERCGALQFLGRFLATFPFGSCYVAIEDSGDQIKARFSTSGDGQVTAEGLRVQTDVMHDVALLTLPFFCIVFRVTAMSTENFPIVLVDVTESIENTQFQCGIMATVTADTKGNDGRQVLFCVGNDQRDHRGKLETRIHIHPLHLNDLLTGKLCVIAGVRVGMVCFEKFMPTGISPTVWHSWRDVIFVACVDPSDNFDVFTHRPFGAELIDEIVDVILLRFARRHFSIQCINPLNRKRDSSRLPKSRNESIELEVVIRHFLAGTYYGNNTMISDKYKQIIQKKHDEVCAYTPGDVKHLLT